MNHIILTIRSQGNKLNSVYSSVSLNIESDTEINTNNCKRLFINCFGADIEITSAIRTYRSHARIRHKQIDSWALFNGYNVHSKKQPRKLVFEFKNINGDHYYTLYQPQGL